MDLGFQVDPLASASSFAIIAMFGALLLKLAGLARMRERRDDAAESLREAKIAILGGHLDPEAYERTARAAESSAREYEAATSFISRDQPQLTSQAQIEDRAGDTAEATKTSRAPNRNKVPQMTQSVLDRRGEGPESETLSSPIGDVIFGLILAPLLGLFAFSMTPDSVMESQARADFDPTCDPCAQLHSKSRSDLNAQSSTESLSDIQSHPFFP
jgi:hypothetical protein